jgi:hypothetical protein
MVKTCFGKRFSCRGSSSSQLAAILEAAGRKRRDGDTHRPGAGQSGEALCSLIQQPLYVEDFLSVLNLDMLFGKRVGTGSIEWE